MNNINKEISVYNIFRKKYELWDISNNLSGFENFEDLKTAISQINGSMEIAKSGIKEHAKRIQGIIQLIETGSYHLLDIEKTVEMFTKEHEFMVYFQVVRDDTIDWMTNSSAYLLYKLYEISGLNK